MTHTLLLNADGRPKCLLPLSALCWQEAIKAIWTDVATVLHAYDDWVVRSPSVAFPVPAVLLLRRSIRRHGWRVRFSSRLVYLRDAYVCQYCGVSFPENELTLDHVLPRKFGGATRWDNCVAACAPCNGRRGHDVSVRPIRAPFRPTYNDLVRERRKFPIAVSHPSWTYYLDWPVEAVTVETRFSRQLNFDFSSCDPIG